MMRIFIFLSSLAATTLLVLLLEDSFLRIPPLGPFLNPYSGYLSNTEKESVSLPREIECQGLNSAVQIGFDKLLIPHIFSDNENDLYFAQGFVEAYHRLWQMELIGYKVEGRLSEIFGKHFVEFDRKQRRKGLMRGALRSLELARKNETHYGYLLSYSAGVNAYIKSMKSGDLPIEYKILDYKPRKWSPLRTLLVFQEMADQLSLDESDLDRTCVKDKLGIELYDSLYTDPPEDLAPVVPSRVRYNFKPPLVENPGIPYPRLNLSKPGKGPHTINGSTSFALGPLRSRDGSSLLASQPDLGLTLPSIWYWVHLRGPSHNVMGATIPGLPGVIIGFNESIAWGITSGKWDVSDWYRIKFRDADRMEYSFDGRWHKSSKTVEEIRVKGEKTVLDTVVYTHHGPVVFDRSFHFDNRMEPPIALKWTGHEGSRGMEALLLLNMADNYDSFKKAISLVRSPPLNITYCSRQGDVAVHVQGAFPIRWENQGKFVMEGDDSRFDWGEWIPIDHLPYDLNPPDNYVFSANQKPADPSYYPYYFFNHRWENFRNRRIRDRLNHMKSAGSRELRLLQHDNFNFLASKALPRMLPSLDSLFHGPERPEYYRLLSSWDYFNRPSSRPATVFQVWWGLLSRQLWSSYLDEQGCYDPPSHYQTLTHLLNANDTLPSGPATTKGSSTWLELLNHSYSMALDSLERWTASHGEDLSWYRYKGTTIPHLIRLKGFSRSGIRIGGGKGIVNAADKQHGPSLRMTVRFNSSGVRAWSVYPGGQPGNPGNPAYDKMVDAWASGEYFELSLTSTLDSDQSYHKVRLVPEK